MSNNSYDSNMALLLAQAVEQAYQYYLQGPNYQIHWRHNPVMVGRSQEKKKETKKKT